MREDKRYLRHEGRPIKGPVDKIAAAAISHLLAFFYNIKELKWLRELFITIRKI